MIQFVTACRRIAAATGLPFDEPRFDAEVWRRQWEKATAPGDLVPAREPAAADSRSLMLPVPKTTVEPGLSRGPISKPVVEWSAEALRVRATVGGNRMVGYVLRPHDTTMREAIDDALDGHGSRMIVLRGGSCTGKTRCAIQAIRDRIPHWTLVRPAGKDQLQYILQTGLGPSTVIWLDEIQIFLGNDNAKHLVERLFESITDGHDVLIIGTVWGSPGSTDFIEQLDLDPAIERFLDVSVRTIDVPSTFSMAQIEQARKLLGPELTDVVDAAADSGELVQNLTGGPHLVEMFEAATGYLSAVLTAAVDLFRIGHTLPIPERLLREAACCYLSSRQQLTMRPDRFDEAVQQAMKPVKGAIAALEPARTTVDSENLDGFVLADYLGYHGKKHRSQPPHARLWEIGAAQAVNHSAARAVALEARRRLLYPQAELLHRRTITLGWIGGWSDLARLAVHCCDLSLVDELVAAARADLGAAHGYPGYLWYEIALLYYAVDDQATAASMLQNANDTFVDWFTVTKLREQLGDSLGADDAARKDCEQQGIPITWHEYLIPHRAGSGDFAGAERAAEAMAAAGFPYGWTEIGNAHMASRGDYRGAARAFQVAAEHGYEESWQDVGRALAMLGEYDAAEQAMLRTALADVDEPQYAWTELAALRHSRGDIAGAEVAAEQGEGMGWARLASERADQGQFEFAEVAAARAADFGDGTGWAELAGEYERAGRPQDAELAARSAAPFESGGLFAGENGWCQIIRHRCERGDWEAAQRACEEYREVDEDYCRKKIADIHDRSGNLPGSKHRVHRPNATDVGDSVRSLEESGDEVGAEEIAIHDAAIHGRVGLWGLIAEIRQRRGDATTHYQLTHFGLHPDGAIREKAAVRRRSTHVSDVSVRRMASEDWKLLREIRLRSLTDAEHVFGARLDEARTRTEEQWRARLTARTQFLATLGTTAVGIIAYELEPVRRAIHVTSLWVDPAARGIGVADQLVTAVLAHAADLGCLTAYLEIVEGNNRAEAVYARNGFARTGRRSLIPGNNPRREFEMARPLPTGG
ncbi:GNAT family N-acetyltransferase [Nocardia wallacei]|uniref:GNAT family N-acetyltransferase n=1 Tax=Nocardia wallacei TaxID=480035 RepID=UPI002457C885|nr:GNAT family N-acetyltransferase [Nocardia wallacei]